MAFDKKVHPDALDFQFQFFACDGSGEAKCHGGLAILVSAQATSVSFDRVLIYLQSLGQQAACWRVAGHRAVCIPARVACMHERGVHELSRAPLPPVF